jgi:hypothetical protein
LRASAFERPWLAAMMSARSLLFMSVLSSI